jgi:predicted ATPase
VNTKNQQEVDLSKLSSGEKQIISIFSKIYLENIDEFVIIFDEPELSLSVEWQKQLLPDIIASNKCRFLMAATHSPFIFENDLDRFVSGISVKYR